MIRPHVNDELDAARQRYRELPNLLAEKVHLVAQKIREPISDTIGAINIVYFPQLGFLVAIPIPSGEVDMDKSLARLQLQGFQLMFSTERVVYVKESITSNLDKEIGDVHSEMVDLEVEIFHVLMEQIMPQKSLLIKLGQELAELDCHLSLAKIANEYNLVRPQIFEDSRIHIVNGRYSAPLVCCLTVCLSEI